MILLERSLVFMAGLICSLLLTLIFIGFGHVTHHDQYQSVTLANSKLGIFFALQSISLQVVPSNLVTVGSEFPA